MEHWVILYDADCGFCRWSIDRLLPLDGGRRLRATPIRSLEGRSILADVHPEAHLASWHLRSPSGEVRSAGAAVAPLLRLLRGGRPFAWIAVRFPRSTGRLYGWVARHRTRLGRLLGATACDVDPSTAAG